MNRKRMAINPDPHSLQYELTAPARQRLWNVCCQSTDEHRFDCQAVPAERRGAGPFGPVRPATPAELVRRLAVDGPGSGT